MTGPAVACDDRLDVGCKRYSAGECIRHGEGTKSREVHPRQLSFTD
jgi:hypothetical protein